MSRNTRSHESVWNSSATAILFPASQSKIKMMLSTGELIACCKNCRLIGSTEHRNSVLTNGKRCLGKTRPHELVYRTTELFKDTQRSAASIPAREMRANAGLGKRNQVKAAQLKVKFYEKINAIELFVPPLERAAALASCHV
ncbi:MAG TPA: hypothetical protein VGN44_05660 [Candidatus Angelobacter sp.]|jgi:hypothetical protein